IDLAFGARAERTGALPNGIRELTGRIHAIDEAPADCTLAFDALDERTEVVRDIPANVTLVHESREAARAGKDSQKRSLGQADHRTAIVYEQDLVAGQRQFISASRTDTVDGRQKLDAGVPAGVLDGQARLVRELAEVHFRGVRGFAQHEDIGAGAE